MSQVHFRTPRVKSFFSQHDHFEYSQIAIQQEEEALVTGDYWQIDGLRRKLSRHHKDKRQYLHEWKGLQAGQFQKNNFLMREKLTLSTRRVARRFSTRKWCTEKKKLSDKMDEFSKGKTVYKIKDGHEIPEDAVRSDIDRQAKLFRGNIGDHPSRASLFIEAVRCPEQVKLSKRRGRQTDFEGTTLDKGSAKKKVVVSYPQEQDELDRIAREMGLEDELQILHRNRLLLHMHVVSKIQKVRLRN